MTDPTPSSPVGCALPEPATAAPPSVLPLTDPAPSSSGTSSAAGGDAFFAFTEERYFQLYLLQRKGFSDSRKDAFLRFDQTVVTIAVGAIALSVAFLEKQPVANEDLRILFLSWVCCIAAVVGILSSLLTGSKADSAQIRALDECMRTGTTDESIARRWNKCTYILNSWSIVFCVLGIILLVLFGVSNLESVGAIRMANHPKDEQEPAKPSRQDFNEELVKNKRDISEQGTRIEKSDRAAPAEDIAGPFKKDKK